MSGAIRNRCEGRRSFVSFFLLTIYSDYCLTVFPVLQVEDGDLKESIDFRLVRVSNPSVLIRNWKKIGIDQVAFCNIRCDSKPSAD